MAAGTYLPIRPFSAEIYTRGTLRLPEKATQTFKKGAPLIYNAGYVEEAGTAPSTVRFIAANDGGNGATDGAKYALVYTITDSDLWEASFEDAYAVTDHGAVYGIVKDATSGYWYVDSADTADQVEVMGPALLKDGIGVVGDTKWRGLVRFQTANIASN